MIDNMSTKGLHERRPQVFLQTHRASQGGQCSNVSFDHLEAWAASSDSEYKFQSRQHRASSPSNTKLFEHGKPQPQHKLDQLPKQYAKVHKFHANSDHSDGSRDKEPDVFVPYLLATRANMVHLRSLTEQGASSSDVSVG